MSFSDKLDWASMAFATLGIVFFAIWIITERAKGKTREAGLNLPKAAHILFQIFMICALTLGLVRGIHANDTAGISVSCFGLGVFAATVLVMFVSRAKQRHNDEREAQMQSVKAMVEDSPKA